MVCVLVVFGTEPLFGRICMPRIPRMNCLIAFSQVQRTEPLLKQINTLYQSTESKLLSLFLNAYESGTLRLNPTHLSAILFNSYLRREHIYFSDAALTLNILGLPSRPRVYY